MAGKIISLATEGGISRPARPEPAWRLHAVSAASLHDMKFPPISYVVPDFVPEGLCILAGRPKVGKSWLALDICLGIAFAQEVLGVVPEIGDVLYCALEDTDRRLQRRMKKLLWPPKGAWPRQLMFATRWRKLDAGGVDDIADWAASASKPRLVVLDTLAGVRPDRHKNDTTYDGDYKALVEAHRLANDGGFAILILTHTRKMSAEDDPLDAISGTLGQVGCADTGMVLSKGPRGATLYLRGRDIEESEKAVVFNADTCRWVILGDAVEVRRSDTRKNILDALDSGVEMGPQEIASATGINPNTVRQRLPGMLKDNEVIQISKGRYKRA
jgi:hypothetical protein